MWLFLLVVVGVLLAVYWAASNGAGPTDNYLKVTALLGVGERPGVVGHRGCRDLVAGVPQNTLLAFRTAIEEHACVKAVELDVHSSGDGELVVVHDGDVAELFDVPASLATTTTAVGELSFEALHGLRYKEAAANEDEAARIPRLRDVLDYCWWSNGRGQPVPVMIEIKAPHAQATVRRVVALLAELEAERQRAGRTLSVYALCWIACFDPWVVYRARRLQPRLLACHLIIGSPLTSVRRATPAGQPGQHAVEAAGYLAARRRLAKRWYGRLLLTGAASATLDWLYNAVVCSSAVGRFLGVNFVAVTPDLAAPAAVASRARRNVTTLVWTVNDRAVRQQLESAGAIVITDHAM